MVFPHLIFIFFLVEKYGQCIYLYQITIQKIDEWLDKS
jgi:hypothetical protein